MEIVRLVQDPDFFFLRLCGTKQILCGAAANICVCLTQNLWLGWERIQVKVLVASRLSQAQMNAEACMPDTNLAVEDDPAEQASDIDTGILPQEGLPMPSEQTSASAEAGGGAVVAKRVSHEGAVGPTTGKGPTARKGGSMEVEDVSNSQQPSDVASVPGHGSNDNSRLIVVNNSVESSPTRTQNSDSVSAPVRALEDCI